MAIVRLNRLRDGTGIVTRDFIIIALTYLAEWASDADILVSFLTVALYLPVPLKQCTDVGSSSGQSGVHSGD